MESSRPPSRFPECVRKVFLHPEWTWTTSRVQLTGVSSASDVYLPVDQSFTGSQGTLDEGLLPISLEDSPEAMTVDETAASPSRPTDIQSVQQDSQFTESAIKDEFDGMASTEPMDTDPTHEVIDAYLLKSLVNPDGGIDSQGPQPWNGITVVREHPTIPYRALSFANRTAVPFPRGDARDLDPAKPSLLYPNRALLWKDTAGNEHTGRDDLFFVEYHFEDAEVPISVAWDRVAIKRYATEDSDEEEIKDDDVARESMKDEGTNDQLMKNDASNDADITVVADWYDVRSVGNSCPEGIDHIPAFKVWLSERPGDENRGPQAEEMPGEWCLVPNTNGSFVYIVIPEEDDSAVPTKSVEKALCADMTYLQPNRRSGSSTTSRSAQ